jgi:hypothetical protein
MLLRNFKEPAARFLRDALQHAFAIFRRVA